MSKWWNAFLSAVELINRSFHRFTNKEFNIARVRVYFNSYSEMLIPTSLWESTSQEDARNPPE